MSLSYLDKTGLTALWAKIKDKFVTMDDVNEELCTEYYNSDISSTNVASSTTALTDIKSIKLTRGIWLAIFTVNFANNSNGYRMTKISTEPDTSSGNTFATVIEQAANGTATRIKNVALLQEYVAASGTIYYFSVRQNSGSTLAVSGNIRLIKLSSEI